VTATVVWGCKFFMDAESAPREGLTPLPARDSEGAAQQALDRCFGRAAKRTGVTTSDRGGVRTSERISDNTFQRSNGMQVIEQSMVVATRSFTTRYDGQAIRVTAGQTRVTKDHQLGRRYPQAKSTRGESGLSSL